MVTIPAAVNYSEQWVSNPSKLFQDPPEGKREINFEVPWATQGGSNNAVSFNVGSGSVAPISQINSLAIDNSDCGMDVRFIFPDSGYTVTIPAGALNVIIPVFSNATQFILAATINNETEEPKDVTRFIVLNYVPPPIAVPPTTSQSIGAQGFQNVDGSTTLTIISASDALYANGSLLAVVFRYSGLTTAAGAVQFKLVDGAGRNLYWFEIAVANATIYNVELANLNPVDFRYSGGLFLQQSGPNIGGQVAYTLPVRLP